jgi:hypothetical protein
MAHSDTRFARVQRQAATGNSARIQAYQRLFDHADTDVALVDTSAEIELGDVLPDGALVLDLISDVTEDWTDGGAGTFSADVGDGSDPDKFTPTILDWDNGIARQVQAAGPIDGGGDQLTVTITGSVNLSTLTAGKTLLTVLYVVPDVEVVVAP